MKLCGIVETSNRHGVPRIRGDDPVADGAGFEPAEPCGLTRLATGRDKPLCHPSKKEKRLRRLVCHGRGGGIRTCTGLRPPASETGASACSATPRCGAYRQKSV